MDGLATRRCLSRVVIAVAMTTAATAYAQSAELAAALAKAAPGEEIAVDDGIYLAMFRQQATQPLPDGWQLAVSHEGGFSVEVPLPFNDFRMRTTTKDNVELRIHSIGGKTPGKLAWSAVCMARRDGKPSQPGEPAPKNKIESIGTPIKAYARTVVWPDRLCMLILEAQGDDPLPPERVRSRFLQSLKRTGPALWPATIVK